MFAHASLLAALLVLLASAPVAAAMWLRLEVAGPVVAGAPAAVTVTTLVMYENACVGDPNASAVPNGVWYSGGSTPSEPTFRLVAYPAGRPDEQLRIPLTHRAADSPFWDGSVTFPTAGPWTIRMAEPYWGTPESDIERCAGARIDVFVNGAPSGREPDPAALLAGAALLGLGAAFSAWRLRAAWTRTRSARPDQPSSR